LISHDRPGFDKLTVEGSVPPYVVLAVAMMGCLKRTHAQQLSSDPFLSPLNSRGVRRGAVSHFECGRKLWEEAKKEEEARKMAAMLQIRLRWPGISDRNMRHELMRIGIF
jgi:hypothetical protein